MSALTEFYRKAQTDAALRADLETANRKFTKEESAEKADKKAVIAETIRIAGNHGISLAPADFELQSGELDEDELDIAAGTGAVLPGIDGTEDRRDAGSGTAPGAGSGKSSPYDRICLFLMG
ncbi:hypothetical protein AGMMS50268_14870 [Spirochaetia bacterium]|nr:hypothetical protein AGMMS50268_14870 [Spirochaetia bacterium]